MSENIREAEALKRLSERVEAVKGHTGFYYKNLVTGVTAGLHDDESFLAASVIKLPMFLYILWKDAEGELSMDTRLKVRNEDKVPVCGAVTLFTDEPECDIRTLCRLTISLSDNTATNILMNYCGIDRLNEGFRAMGLEKTHIERLLFDSKAGAEGKENKICPRELGILLEKLYKNEFVSEKVCKEAIDTLLTQQINHKLDGKICGAVPIAHKTGEDDLLSNDVGIVYAKEPFVICFAGHDTDVYAWETVIREGAYELYKAVEG